MAIRVVRLGSPRTRTEGLRIGTVRRPPRGVSRKDYAKRDFFDVWLPQLAPSGELLRMVKPAAGTKGAWERFERRYVRELSSPDNARLLDLLATLSRTTDFSIGCYCADEARCHRSILKRVLRERGARMA